MIVAKVVKKYIIVWLPCRKSTEYDDTLGEVFSCHNTFEKHIDESGPVR